MAFLGKISAVVTANTTDFTKKIEGTKQELISLKRQLSGYQLNLDSRSLDGTLTKLQKFNRTLQEAAKLTPFERLANGFPDLKRLADQFRLFEDVGKPLTRVKDQIEGLSNSVQSQLYPELEKTQKGFQRLFNEISTGDATFANSKKRVDNLLASLSRLGRVSSAASDIGQLTARLNASNTGASFFQPQAQESLQRSLALRGQAEKIPARLRTSVFADLAVDAERNAQQIEEQAARVAKALLEIERYGRTPRRADTLANEQQALERLTRQQEAINNQFAREIRSTEIRQIISPEADSLVDSLKAKFQQLAGELRAINGSRFDGVIGSVGVLVEQLNRGEVSAKKVRAALDGLAKVRAASEIGASYEDAADRALRSQRDRDSRTVQEAAGFQRQQVRQIASRRFGRLNDAVIRSDDRIAGLENDRQELVALRAAGRLGDDSAITQVESQIAAERSRRDRAAALAARVGQARQRNLASVDVNERLGLERINFGDVTARQRDLQQRAESLGLAPLIKEAEQLNRSAIDLNKSLSAAFRAAKEGPDQGAAALDAFQSKLFGQIKAYDALEKRIETASRAQREFNQFLSAAGGRGDKLDPTLEGAAADIMTARQFRGQFARENDAGRVAVANRIYQAEEKINRLIFQRQQIESASNLTNEKRAKAFEKNKKLIEAETQAVLKRTAEESRGVFSEQQVSAAAARRRKSTGSFGVAGAAAAQLAAQQGLFAIDDLLSSTGGLEYKLRAVGNNITQLGLLLGQSGVIPGLSATAGLAAGLAVVVGGQLLSAFLRFATGADEADRRVEAMNDALARQKSLAESLRQAFESLGDSIARKAFSSGAREAREFAKQIEEVAKKQKGLRDARTADLDPTVQRERAIQGARAKQLEGETNIGRRITLQQEIRQSQERERAAAEAAANRPAPSGADAAAAIRAAGSALFARRTRGEEVLTPQDFAVLAEARQRADATAGAGPEALRDLLQQQQDSLVNSAFAADSAVAEQIRQLEVLIASLEAPIRKANDALVVSILEGAQKVASSLAATQQLLDETVVPFSQTRAEADKAAKELEKVVTELGKASDPKRIAELKKQQEDLGKQSEAYRSAAEVIRTFADTVKRISTDLVNAVEGEARSNADRARRDANRAKADMQVDGEFGPNGERRRPGDASRDAERADRRRRILEREARRAQDEADRVRKENDRVRREFEAGIADDPIVKAERKRLEELQAIIDSKDPAVTEEQKARAAEEKASIQRTQERRYEDSPEGRSAAARADRADVRAAQVQEELRQEDERFRAGLRGRDLGLTDSERARREVRDGIADIAAARAENMLSMRQADEQASRFVSEQMRSAAPALFSMADAVQNSIMQGPSRAALQATDVSTTEGQRELNRLLRGDDPARNENLVELRKQSETLDKILKQAEEEAKARGIVLDLK